MNRAIYERMRPIATVYTIGHCRDKGDKDE